MLKRNIMMALGSAALVLGATAPAQAQFGDLKNLAKKEAKKKAKREAQKELKKLSNQSKRTTSQQSSASGIAASQGAPGQPDANVRALTQCSSLSVSNAMIGTLGDYTFQKGMSSEKRSGFLNRRSVSATDGCIMPSMAPREVLYMEVDTAAYEAMGNSNDWTMQCVKPDNLSEGAVNDLEPKGEYPYRVNFLSGKDVMLHCGNSEGVSECATGSNSSRSGAWKKKLESRGKTMLSVLATTSTLAPSSGEKLYCQYYNAPSGKSLFAFQYLRTRN